MVRPVPPAPARVYHTDSVESTSKFNHLLLRFSQIYTILTLWSQLQNRAGDYLIGHVRIPY